MAAYTTIDDPSAYMKIQLYTGTGSSNAITFDDTDTDMQPDLVWLKQRSPAIASHALVDSVRGTGKFVASNSGTGDTDDSYNVTAFGSDGFTLGASSGSADVNVSTETYVSWNWKESATSGFDIVAYTGSGSAKTESHSLSAVPHFMIVKNRTDTDAWRIYHHENTAAPETDYLVLDTDAATVDDSTDWNDTAPTSSVFSVGTSDQTNEDGDSFIAYLFSEKQGFSKFGSHVGNGNADGGPFIYMGFRPAFFMVKKTSGTNNWLMFDNKRQGFNKDGAGGNDELQADTYGIEASSERCDFLSNGVKIRNDGGWANTDDGTYIWAAFAESPLANSSGVPNNAR